MKPSIRNLKTIVLEKKDKVATITLNTPDRLNAMSPQQVLDLIEVFDELDGDDGIRAVIVTGAGRAFMAGGDVENDIKPLSTKTPSEFNAYFAQGELLYGAPIKMKKPVIAAINGYAVGAGLDLAMSCDIRVASEKAQFGQFFVKMGLVPEAGAYLMTRLIGLGRAKLLSFTGDLIDAKEAEKIGLVEMVVPPNQLMTIAWELAKRLADGPKSIEFIKKQLNEALGMTFGAAMDFAIRLQYQCVHTEDHREAVSAFLEKRDPVFRGK